MRVDFIKKYNLALLGVLVILTIFSCQKETYYKDTGTLDPVYSGSSLDYLKEKGYQFDSLVKVIHLAGLDDVIDKSSCTFFAPADSSINLAIGFLNNDLKIYGRDTVSDLAQISPVVWRETLSMYIFDSVKKVVDYPQLDFLTLPSFHGQAYTCYGGERIMNIGAVYDDASGVKYAGYRHLVLSYIPSYSAPLVNWLNAYVASSDITTHNGIIHAIRYTSHIFGFDPFNFLSSAEKNGIAPRS